MKKKVDSRIRTLIENHVKTRHRSMFVLVGDKGRDQVRFTYQRKFTHIICNHYDSFPKDPDQKYAYAKLHSQPPLP